jgi:hypothetical protein
MVDDLHRQRPIEVGIGVGDTVHIGDLDDSRELALL